MSESEVHAQDQIKCPYCGYLWECEGESGHTTYWGSEMGPKSDECGNCLAELSIREVVTRVWEVVVTKSGEKDLEKHDE